MSGCSSTARPRDRARARRLHAGARRGRDAGHESGPARRLAARLRRRTRQLPRRRHSPDCRGRRGVGAAARRRALPVLGAARAPHRRMRDAGARAGDAGRDAPTALRARALYCAAVLADILADPTPPKPQPGGLRHLSRSSATPRAGHDDDGDGVAGAAARPLRRGDRAVRRDRRALGAARRRDGRRSGDQQHGARRRSSRATSSSRAACLSSWWRRRRPAATFAASPRRSTGSATSRVGRQSRRRSPLLPGEPRHLSRDRRSLGDRPRAGRSGDRRPSRRRLRCGRRSLTEALQAFRALGHQRGVVRQLEALSWCASCQSRDEAAVALAGAAAAIRHESAPRPSRSNGSRSSGRWRWRAAASRRGLRRRVERGACQRRSIGSSIWRPVRTP